MKHWLITTTQSVDRDALAKSLRAFGCDLTEAFSEPIPVADDQVFEVSGPNDLPKWLSDLPYVKSVNPDSELTLYETSELPPGDKVKYQS